MRNPKSPSRTHSRPSFAVCQEGVFDCFQLGVSRSTTEYWLSSQCRLHHPQLPDRQPISQWSNPNSRDIKLAAWRVSFTWHRPLVQREHPVPVRTKPSSVHLIPHLPLLPPPRVLLCPSQIPHSPSLLLLHARRQEPPRAGNEHDTIDKETKKTLRDREEKQLRKCGPSLRDPVDSGRSGQGLARQSCGADAGFPRHRRVKSLCIHLLWGAGPVCSATKKRACSSLQQSGDLVDGRSHAQSRVLSTPMLLSPPCRVLRPEGSSPPPCGLCQPP